MVHWIIVFCSPEIGVNGAKRAENWSFFPFEHIINMLSPISGQFSHCNPLKTENQTPYSAY